MHVFGLWKEAGMLERTHGQNMQTLYRKAPGTSLLENTAKTTIPPCHSLIISSSTNIPCFVSFLTKLTSAEGSGLNQ